MDALVEPVDLAVITVSRCADTGELRDPYEYFLVAASAALPKSRLEHKMKTISINCISGTTGRPKGVEYTYRGAYLNLLAKRSPLWTRCTTGSSATDISRRLTTGLAHMPVGAAARLSDA